MANADHFFSRWSRRKTAAEQGRPVEEPPRQPAQTTPLLLPEATVNPAPMLASEQPAVEEPVLPELTLEDVKGLTPDSDFKPFIARNVAPEVKNAAMKRLFSDPHYNVMDRLDIYIDDYSQPDPLPASMLRQMVSAKFLNLFDSDEDLSAQKVQPLGDDADTVAITDVAQCQPSAAAASDPIELPDLTGSTPVMTHSPANPDHNAHADLRLQPHHAAIGPEFGESPERKPGTS